MCVIMMVLLEGNAVDFITFILYIGLYETFGCIAAEG